MSRPSHLESPASNWMKTALFLVLAFAPLAWCTSRCNYETLDFQTDNLTVNQSATLNNSGGTTTIKGAATLQSTENVTGLVTLGGGITGLPATSCTAGQALTADSTTGAGTCTTLVSGTTGNLSAFTSAGAVGNYAGSSPAACGAGNAATQITESAAGVISYTCSPFGSSSLTNGAGNNVVPKSNGANLVASDITDNGTTIDLSNGAAKATVAVASGNATFANTIATAGFTANGGNFVCNTGGCAFELAQAQGTATIPYVQANAGTPNGVVTSTHAGDFIVDTSTPNLWLATAASSSVWQRVPGTYINRQVFTSAGTATYTPTAGTRYVVVRMCGGGGGGGGTTTTGANQGSAGGGGASGAYIELHIGGFTGAVLTGSASNVTIGAAGTAGAVGGGSGGAGGLSSIAISGTTYTAQGGGGGGGQGAVAAGYSNGGVVTGGSSAGDVLTGQSGGYGVYISTTFSFPSSGYGGSSPFGLGGQPVTNATSGGNAGSGHCSGGSGGATGVSASQQSGAVGTTGQIIVDEFD